MAGVLFRVDSLHKLVAYPVHVTPAQPVEMPFIVGAQQQLRTFARAALCKVWQEEGGESRSR